MVDFTLDEVRSLRMTEPFQLVEGKQVPVYPARFPLWKSSFRIHTFQEEIEMIRGSTRAPASTSASTRR
jgi:glycerophosphoryl diester phosphodiesterase